MDPNLCMDERGREDVTPCGSVSPSWRFDVL